MFNKLLNIKSNRGITLVTLIVTIIVLLILAGITINAIVNGDGTIEKAGEAKSNTESINNKTIVDNAVVLAMGKEQGKTLHLNTLTNAIGDVGTVAQEGQYFTVTIQGYKYWVTVEGEVLDKKPPEVGDSVDYVTSLNNVTLDDWKVFYVEGNYTYLILSDYLPNSAVNITNVGKVGKYLVYSNSRENLINAMTTSSNWSSLLIGILNGKSIDYSTSADTNIKAMGSPTLDLYVNSWNAKYPSNLIYTATNSNGYYYVGNSENPTSTLVGKPNSDVLYYPHTSGYEDCYGYFLASPSAHGVDYLMDVCSNGEVRFKLYDYAYNYGVGDAFRPVICLPSSALR